MPLRNNSTLSHPDSFFIIPFQKKIIIKKTCLAHTQNHSFNHSLSLIAHCVNRVLFLSLLVQEKERVGGGRSWGCHCTSSSLLIFPPPPPAALKKRNKKCPHPQHHLPLPIPFRNNKKTKNNKRAPLTASLLSAFIHLQNGVLYNSRVFDSKKKKKKKRQKC